MKKIMMIPAMLTFLLACGNVVMDAYDERWKVGLPLLTTTVISNIHAVSAASGGDITDEGYSPVTVRGVCWNTNGSPTIADNKTSDGTGTGSFASTLAGLSIGTTYYVRAYATNDHGTAYGNQVSFQSLFDLVAGDAYQGGVVFFVSGTYPNQYGKVLTMHGQGTTYIPWCNTQTNTGATSTTDGPNNTELIYTNQGTGGSYAAKYCKDYRGGGYSDWYLPAREELVSIWNSGLFGSNAYWWTSTQDTIDDAYLVYWPTGGFNVLSKLLNAWACPVRRFGVFP